jgi:hypothetical protein
MPASRFAAWVGVGSESAVTRVTKVAETSNPSRSTALETAAAGNPRRGAEGY